MKQYTVLEIEIISFVEKDIIRTSGEDQDSFTDGDNDIFSKQ